MPNSETLSNKLRGQEFPLFYNMFEAINIAIRAILEWAKSNEKELKEIVENYLIKFNPKEASKLYQSVLPKEAKEALTCLNYAYYLNEINVDNSEIYMAEQEDGCLHLICVFTLGDERYYFEPHLIPHQAIRVVTDQEFQSTKFIAKVIKINSDSNNFSSTITSKSSKESMRFNLRPLDTPQNATINDYLGYLTLVHHLYRKTHVFLSNIDSKIPKAISLNEKGELIITLPFDEMQTDEVLSYAITDIKSQTNSDEVEDSNNEAQSQTSKIRISIENIENLQEFITSKFSIDIYKSLIEFKENMETLKEIQDFYSEITID
jgi:hypothetical protein